MNRKELFYFTAKCIILKENPEYKASVFSQFDSGNIDLEKFVLLCSNNLVLPTIYLNFKKFNLINVFPDDFIIHLENIYNLNKIRNTEILEQIEEINKYLLNENIIPLYLKGTANLMDNLYSDIGERMIGDIDFLVEEKNYQKTIELMQAIGYNSDIISYNGIKTNKHYPRMHRGDVPADIEIHRVPVDIKYSKQFSSDINFADKKKIKTKENCFIQSDEHRLIHNFIHSQLSNSGYSHRIVSLRDLYDFYLLSQRTKLESIFHQIEEKKKAKTYCNLVNMILHDGIDKNLCNVNTEEDYCLRFNWFINHPRQHQWFIYFMKTIEIFFEWPFDTLKNTVLNKSMREGYINRLKDPRWYKYKYSEIKSNLEK